jgi:transposase
MDELILAKAKILKGRGLTHKEIANRLGVGITTIYRYLDLEYNEREKASRMKRYYKNKEQEKEYVKNNREQIRKYKKEYYKNHKSKFKTYKENYLKRHRTEINGRRVIRYYKSKPNTDKLMTLRCTAYE